MSDLTLIYEGKAKTLYQGPASDEIFIYFKDDTTAFNGEKKEIITQKGEINFQISRLIFKYLEKNGVKTHYLKPVDERTILAKKLDIIPVEFVIRNIAAGSVLKRIPVKQGFEFKSPIIEYFYKSDEMGDPMINPYHIEACNLCSMENLMTITEKTFRVNHLLKSLFDKCGIILVDFKLEFGIDSQNNIMLGDEISPDSCRLWDKVTKEVLDKDVFRKGNGNIVDKYKKVLERLQEELNDKSQSLC
ncbi:MAG: phosphoribosylaminoimidazolesuccinocarboxamide synthase [Candidatus Muirbacterium halophilum]|nr:phosphoribosylaminoimidazolesuccinocarboxamide synthase [Candidatus Muirbacterium halophilum]MCK9474926.1 phosphoribosylaminoimidazolesuccinocarboxamide synthase [Candidatus Muirbacterium halophilum]